MAKLEALFTPLSVRGLALKNRLVMPPMHTAFGTETGGLTARLLDYYVRRARGGVGLIIQEATAVRPDGKGARRWLGMWDDSSVAGWRELVAAVHDGGAKMAVQLHHAGGVASSKVTGTQPVAPSTWTYREAPNILSTSEVVALEDAFAEAAHRALDAGYDAVELHAGHGYLLTQFLSPLSNAREDEYGGDVAGRARFVCNIVAKIRRVAGPDLPISVRLSVDEFLPGGTTLADSQQVAVKLVEAGADIIHASGGRLPLIANVIAPMEVPHGNLLHLAAGIKQVVSVPVIAVGHITDARMAEDVLRLGQADLVAMGRALIADPDLPAKVLEGRLDDIRPCIGCHQGCQAVELSCLSNPEAGHERELELVPAKRSKKVVVIGGGPGGLEAARVAAIRGHRVTLFEKDTRLGGRLIVGMMPPHKQEIGLLVEHLGAQVQKLGVEVRLGEAAALAVLRAAGAEEVIVANGAEPVVPDLPGVERPNVVLAEDVLLGRATSGPQVVVMGGGSTGCEVAEYLAAQRRQVKIVTRIERDQDLAADVPFHRRRLLMDRLKALGVAVLKDTTLQAVEAGGVILRHGEEQARVPADTVVLAQGYRPVTAVAAEMSALGVPVHVIGDAVKSRTAKEAIREGAEVARAV